MSEQQLLENQTVHTENGPLSYTIRKVGIQGDTAYGVIEIDGQEIPVEGRHPTLENEQVTAAEWYINDDSI
jgi:hypothetical protein